MSAVCVSFSSTSFKLSGSSLYAVFMPRSFVNAAETLTSFSSACDSSSVLEAAGSLEPASTLGPPVTAFDDAPPACFFLLPPLFELASRSFKFWNRNFTSCRNPPTSSSHFPYISSKSRCSTRHASFPITSAASRLAAISRSASSSLSASALIIISVCCRITPLASFARFLSTSRMRFRTSSECGALFAFAFFIRSLTSGRCIAS
mmetsp:Transcript_1681/g.5603  ORF Transcript_1681/g.5603 Transcript_1681/m.5603 type:complete len:205 (-) Transcript_1681:481-1095(-)